MFCPKCGAQVPDDAAFCKTCGSKVEVAAHSPPPPVGFQPSPAVAGNAAPAPAYGSFSARYVGIIVFGALFFIWLIMGAATPYFAEVANLSNIFINLAYIGTAAVGMVVVGRTGGVDLSIGGMIAVSSVLIGVFAAHGSLAVGVLLAVLVCVAVGFINGIFSLLLRIPSVFVTLVTLMLTRYLAWLITDKTIILKNIIAFDVLAPLVFIAVLAGGFLFVFFTRLGKPFRQREQDKKPVLLYMLAFAFSGFAAAMAGMLITFRVHAALPQTASGIEMSLLFILLVAGSSTLFDNRVAPVLVAGLGSLFLGIWQNALNLLQVSAYLQYFLLPFFLLLALALDRVYRRNIFPFKPLDSKA